MNKRYYKIDWDKNIIYNAETFNKIEKLKQEIYCQLKTERFQYPIYDLQYGSEIYTLYGKDFSYAEAEIERIILEIVPKIENVLNVYDIEVEPSNNNVLNISFKIDTYDGTEINLNYPLVLTE